MPLNELRENTKDIAVLQERVGSLCESVEDLKVNHISHLSEDVKKVLEILTSHSKKFVSYDLVVKIVFGVAGTLLMGTIGLLFK